MLKYILLAVILTACNNDNDNENWLDNNQWNGAGGVLATGQ
jgi:hypothetical protein